MALVLQSASAAYWSVLTVIDTDRCWTYSPINGMIFYFCEFGRDKNWTISMYRVSSSSRLWAQRPNTESRHVRHSAAVVKAAGSRCRMWHTNVIARSEFLFSASPLCAARRCVLFSHPLLPWNSELVASFQFPYFSLFSPRSSFPRSSCSQSSATPDHFPLFHALTLPSAPAPAAG